VGNWQQNLKKVTYLHMGELVCTNPKCQFLNSAFGQFEFLNSAFGQFAICGTNSYVTALSAFTLLLQLLALSRHFTFLCTHHNINHTSKDEFDEIDDIPTAYLLYHSICIQCNKLLIYILWEEHQQHCTACHRRATRHSSVLSLQHSMHDQA